MPRPSVRSERVPQILQAATAVFARNGIAQTRVEDIALEAQLSKASLYLYFASKDEIVEALLQQFFQASFVELQRLVQGKQTVRQRLIKWSRGWAAQVQHNTDLLSISFEFQSAAVRQNSTRAVMKHYYQQYQIYLMQLIEQGSASGEFRAVQAQPVATALAAMLEGLLVLWMLDSTNLDLARAAEQSIETLLRGLEP